MVVECLLSMYRALVLFTSTTNKTQNRLWVRQKDWPWSFDLLCDGHNMFSKNNNKEKKKKTTTYSQRSYIVVGVETAQISKSKVNGT